MGCIYKVTNKINGKIYVGQTRRKLAERWREHVYYSLKGNEPYVSILHSAIRKYGAENFVCEEIESCPSNLLDEREIYWIAYYGSYKNGYNSCIGGGGGQKCTDEELLALWNSGLSVGEIAEKVPIVTFTISNQLRYLGVTKEEIISRGNEHARSKRYTPVYQYSLDGDFIREFPSLKSAQEFSGCDRIRYDGKQKVFGGHQYRPYKVDKIDPVKVRKKKEPPPPKPPKTKKPPKVKKCKSSAERAIPVYQYTMDGEYVASFNSISSALRQFGDCHGTGGIRSACIGRSRHSHGYRWSCEKVDRLPPMRDTRHGVPVDMFDLNGNYIRTYESVKSASEDVGVSRSVISVALGRADRSAGGYRWDYTDKAF